ncbi:MAG: hypothetical protein WCY25_06995 [Moheibacter sp.]
MMKKITLSFILMALCLTTLTAQKKNNFEFGLHFGIPIVKSQNPEPGFEDYGEEEYNFNIGLTVGYYFGITDKIKVGPLIGYDHFITNFDEVDDADYGDGSYYDDYYYYDPSLDFDADGLGFILIGPSAKFYFANKFYGGLDIGYAHSLSIDVGGLFFRPRISFSTNRIDLYTFYKGINLAKGKYYYDENFHLGSAGIGVMFKF